MDGSSDATFHRALILHRQGRHADAANELRRALAANPHDARAHAMLGLCLAELKEYKEATREAQSAVGLAPDVPFSHYVLAQVLYRRNRADEALAPAHEAIRLDPDNADYFALLSALRLEQRQWPAALEAAELGLRGDPDHTQCNNLRAMALVKLGRRAEAGQSIGAALARDPEDASTHANQGWALLHQGEHKKALEHFREALRLDPTLEWARAGIVEALKAHYALYRWMLLYFLWMSRLGERAQWGIVLGAYFGNRLLRDLAARYPRLAPFVWPVLIAYMVFALLTWLADPLFTLLLRLNRFGKLALSREQVVASNVIGSLLLGALLSLGAWLVTGRTAFEDLALVLGLLMLPVSGLCKCPAGWPRVAMTVACGLLALVGLGCAALDFALPSYPPPARHDLFQIADAAFSVFIWGVLISSLGANYLRGVRVRK